MWFANSAFQANTMAWKGTATTFFHVPRFNSHQQHQVDPGGKIISQVAMMRCGNISLRCLGSRPQLSSAATGKFVTSSVVFARLRYRADCPGSGAPAASRPPTPL